VVCCGTPAALQRSPGVGATDVGVAEAEGDTTGGEDSGDGYVGSTSGGGEAMAPARVLMAEGGGDGSGTEVVVVAIIVAACASGDGTDGCGDTGATTGAGVGGMSVAGGGFTVRTGAEVGASVAAVADRAGTTMEAKNGACGVVWASVGATMAADVGVTEVACGLPVRMSSRKSRVSVVIFIKMTLNLSTSPCNSATMAAMWCRSSDVKDMAVLLEDMGVA
jgi:hypothetical protein